MSPTIWTVGHSTMCAEVLWWRCHRRLIADVLVSLGAQVLHIRDEHVVEAHRLAAPAQLVDGQLTYEVVIPKGTESEA